jgi:hypothetical protein
MVSSWFPVWIVDVSIAGRPGPISTIRMDVERIDFERSATDEDAARAGE